MMSPLTTVTAGETRTAVSPPGSPQPARRRPARLPPVPRAPRGQGRAPPSPPLSRPLTKRAPARLDPKIFQGFGEGIEPLQPPQRVHGAARPGTKAAFRGRLPRQLSRPGPAGSAPHRPAPPPQPPVPALRYGARRDPPRPPLEGRLGQ